MSIHLEDDVEAGEKSGAKDDAPQETMSVKLERRRKIEEFNEARRLKDELAEYDI